MALIEGQKRNWEKKQNEKHLSEGVSEVLNEVLANRFYLPEYFSCLFQNDLI